MTKETMDLIKGKAIGVNNPYQEKVFRKLCREYKIIISAKPIRLKKYPTYFILLGNMDNLTAYENPDLDGCETSVIRSGYTPMSLDYFKNTMFRQGDSI